MLIILSYVTSKHVTQYKRDVFDIIPDISSVKEHDKDGTDCVFEIGRECLIAEDVECRDTNNSDDERLTLMNRRRQLRRLFVRWREVNTREE